MDYGALIREAWAITWRYRFLWILGILAGGAVGLPALNGGSGGTTWRTDQREVQQISPQVASAAQDMGLWAAANVMLLVALGIVLVLVLLVLLVVSFIAQGGMARATTDLATGHPASFGSAWRVGVHLFWRYVGLWLILAGIALAIGFLAAAIFAMVGFAAMVGLQAVAVAVAVAAGALIVAGFVAFVLSIARGSALPTWLTVLAAAVFALPIITVLIVVALSLSIVVAYAQRAIVVEDIGPLQALRSGWHLMRAHVGESLVTWLVNLGLALASSLVGFALIAGVLLLLAAGGVVMFALAQFSALTIVYIGLGGLVLLAAGLVVGGIVNTFFWSYWSLAYMRLSGRATAPAI